MSATISPRATSLAELQGAFQDFVLARCDTFQSEVRDSRKADRTTLLDVYCEGYALRLIEVLTTDYPGLIAMIGSASFDDMARAYIAAHPSRHPSVRWFGRSLTDFLEIDGSLQPFASRRRNGALRMGTGRSVGRARHGPYTGRCAHRPAA